MKIGIIGRTRMLLDSVKLLYETNYTIPFIYTCKAEDFYSCSESEFFLAKKIGADFYCDLKINEIDRVNIISSYSCDLALSINWLTILNEPICSAFKYGIWNAHLGDLPKYRGNACPNWAILNQEESIALTIHQIEPNFLDSGDILKKIFLKLDVNTYITDIYNWIGQRLPNFFLETVDAFKHNSLIAKKQSFDQKDILRCYPRKPEDSRIKWENSANNIHALIRASSHPFSGAFCYLENGDKFFIWRAELEEHYGRFNAMPGQVLSIQGKCPVIACGQGVIKLTKFSIETESFDTNNYIFKSLRARLL